ncbi:hypothetical protein HPB51_003137 [Rhipicephalus microplus]|uniref:Uncharacterized protein n=1 Tax=Rhipicephalus microplus TaxID=6941 RepID=A0A9J6EKI1_RHIMP|nr:hypothetical protein HPB51_003137 [Rhipicephalus microplus]
MVSFPHFMLRRSGGHPFSTLYWTGFVVSPVYTCRLALLLFLVRTEDEIRRPSRRLDSFKHSFLRSALGSVHVPSAPHVPVHPQHASGLALSPNNTALCPRRTTAPLVTFPANQGMSSPEPEILAIAGVRDGGRHLPPEIIDPLRSKFRTAQDGASSNTPLGNGAPPLNREHPRCGRCTWQHGARGVGDRTPAPSTAVSSRAYALRARTSRFPQCRTVTAGSCDRRWLGKLGSPAATSTRRPLPHSSANSGCASGVVGDGARRQLARDHARGCFTRAKEHVEAILPTSKTACHSSSRAHRRVVLRGEASAMASKEGETFHDAKDDAEPEDRDNQRNMGESFVPQWT